MSLPQATIRPATADDGYCLADIVMEATKAQGRWPDMSASEQAEWRDGFADWSRQTVQESNPDNVLSVVMIGAEIVGRLRVVRRDLAGPREAATRCIQLAGIQLVPAAQRRGIGTSIIRDLQDAARQEGLPLLIGVEKDNPGARRLYERLGCVLKEEDDQEYLLIWLPA